MPVILDSGGRLPLGLKLLNGETAHTRIIVAATDRMCLDHRQLLESRGLEVIGLPASLDGIGVDPESLLKVLSERGVQSVLLEGGASVQGSFRDAACIDEVWAFTAPMLIGGKDAPAAYAAKGSKTLGDATLLHSVEVENLGSDMLIRGLVGTPDNTSHSNNTQQ
jgi:diaminohydroxyphosphoribosylaminopyrimidine deaminase/5-amino-6-(5-phosphoribosylamino)uracil reductase